MDQRRARTPPHQRAEQIVLDAEKFKASLQPPRGEPPLLNTSPSGITNEVYLKRLFDNDNEFFHVTCHVDSNLKTKIENGDFMDLERLLPKSRRGAPRSSFEEGACQLFVKGGNTYFAPAQDPR